MKNQRGVALIVVLLVVALVSIIAADMGTRLQYQVKRSISIKDNNQAYWYAIAAEQFAQKTVSQLWQQPSSEPIDSTQPWAQQAIQFPMPGGGIEATLEDLQSCFNLNALRAGGSGTRSSASSGSSSGSRTTGTGSSTTGSGSTTPASGTTSSTTIKSSPASQAFRELLSTRELNIPSLNQDTLHESLLDWLDSNTNLTGSFGAEDSDYESLPHPYLPANNLMSSKSELRMVNGAELPWLQELMPYVCVIPGDNRLRINIQTLTPERAPLLAALLKGLPVSDAESLIGSIPYNDVEDFLGQPSVNALNLTAEQKAMFTDETEYFILHVKTTYNSAVFKMSSVLKKVNSNQAQVIRREFGGPL